MKGLSITNDSVSLEFNIENFTELVQGIDIQNLQVNGSNLLSASLSSTRNWDFAGVTRNDNVLNLSTVSMDGISVNNVDPLFTLNLTLEESWSLITLSAPTLTVNDIDYQFTDLTIANTKETDSLKIHNLEYLENSDSNYTTQFVELSGGQTLITQHSGDGYNHHAEIIGESSTLSVTFNTLGSISANPEAIELLNGNIFFVFGKKGQVISSNNEVIKPIFDVTENGAFWSVVDRNPITNEIIVLSTSSGIDNNGIVVSEFNSDISEKIDEKVILSIPKDPEEYMSNSPFGTTPIFDARFSKEGDLFIVRSENKGFETERGNIYIQKFDNNFNLISEKVLISTDLNADSGFPRLTIQDEKIFVNWVDRDYEIYKSYQWRETQYTQKFIILDKDLNTLSNELEFHFPKSTGSIGNEVYYYDNGELNEPPSFVLYDNDVTYRAILETGTYIGLDSADNFNAENSSGSVIIDGKRGNDTITGSQFADIIKGGLGNDNVFGGDGDDKFIYSNGNDTFSGGLGTDLIELFQNQFSDIQNVRKNNDDYIIEFSDKTLTLNSVETVKDINGLSKNINSLFDEFKNFPPTSISLDASSVTENDIGGHIANISGEDPDDDSLTYSVLSANDGSMLEIIGTMVHFKSGVSADYEQDQSLQFTLRATDPDGLYKDQAFSLNVLDDVSDNPLNLTKIELALKQEHFGSSSSDKMDAGDLLSDLKLHGGKGHDELFGGKGSDELDGGEDNDTLLGRSGNDFLKGGLGNDILNGGGGTDTIVFGDLNSHIRLGPTFHKQVQDTGHGLDTIYTKNIENVITGSGNDIVMGQNLDNVIDTGSGNDFIKGGAGDDILKGGLGDDTIHGGKGIDTIAFGDLDTRISLGSWWHNRSQDTGHGLDKIYTKNIENVKTGSGNDEIYGQWFDNVLDAGSGNDTVLGRAGDDTLIGGLGNDILNGGNGIDTIVFGDLDTRINLGGWLHNVAQDTGHGLDKIYTNKTENVTTGSGKDVIQGQHLDNVLISGSGDDEIKAKGGNDILLGGLGKDILEGGAGADRFRFNADDGEDIIKDFNGSDGDKIQFMKTQNDSSDISYTSDGNNTIVNWENVSVTVENFTDNDLHQYVEWMMIV